MTESASSPAAGVDAAAPRTSAGALLRAARVAGGLSIDTVAQQLRLAPRQCADFASACAAGDWARALVLHDRLFDLHKAMFSDTSPGPVKYALSRVHDWFSPEVRLPIIPASEASQKAVDAALSAAGVI